MSTCDHSFRAMGSDIRLIIEGPGPGLPEAADAAAEAQRLIEEYDARLSRFRPESELCALNADPRDVIPASALLRDAVRGGIWAAERTGGLVDPTLLGELEAAGYVSSRDGIEQASLAEALAFAPERRMAEARSSSRWLEIEIDEAFGVIRRPPGVRFDNGGTGKGLAADLVADHLAGYLRFVIDCGGDLRIGGSTVDEHPVEVHVEHPLTRERSYAVTVGGGGIATSGLNIRVWRNPDGSFAHHLLDPATGRPAWTGLVGATALGATALEAETLSKAALLSGPERARELLAARGGLIVNEDGESELVGPIEVRPRYSITVPSGLAGIRAAA